MEECKLHPQTKGNEDLNVTVNLFVTKEVVPKRGAEGNHGADERGILSAPRLVPSHWVVTTLLITAVFFSDGLYLMSES